MRYLILSLLLVSGSALADDWTKADTVREGVFFGFTVRDWAQTRYIAKHPDTFHENNDLLGNHPSVGKVDNYFSSAIVGHAAISYLLPHAWREGWQYVWIGVEVQKTTHNHSIGIRLNF